jgi:ATP-dependent exoDNAse (exonuclease V) alpha subunit
LGKNFIHAKISLMTQPEIFEILKSGQNAFLTGPAGSGKTFLLNQYISYLKDNKVEVGITASTGIAATHLDGRTIHSWCGMGINHKLTKAQLTKLKRKKHLKDRIKNTKVLIIDEISMLDSKRLDLVDKICQAIRKNESPFGGMQTILCGDFFQLPPVSRGKENGDFVTKSKIWKAMDIKICYIEEQYRQDDEQFLKVLNDIRGDRVTQETCEILESRINQPVNIDIKPTKLYTHNADVDVFNFLELNRLDEKEKVFHMMSYGPSVLVDILKKNCLTSEMLTLKVGAIVMFVKNNFDKKYVNGTLGKIIEFDEDSGNPIVETTSGNTITAAPERWVVEEDGEDIAAITQVPLRLAWAITVHKSQGMSLDCAEIDLSKTFEYGMGYVALSRVRSLGGITLLGINKLALKVNEEATKLDKKLYKQSQKDLEEVKKLTKRQIKKLQKDFIKD